MTFNKILTADEIRESEQHFSENGGSLKELMFTAGSAAFEAIRSVYDINNKSFAVLCGTGNNGGDGFVIAKKLYDFGCPVSIILPFGEPKTENAKYYYSLIDKSIISEDFSGEFDFYIDALFGIGFSREPDEKLAGLFDLINRKNGVKIAVDIPSGVCADGRVFSSAVYADLTVTFISPKPCFILNSSVDHCGKVIISDIGVSPVGGTYNVNPKPIFPRRRVCTHKGSYGTALMICGSYGMAGAAILAAKAALRSGVGLVKCVLPKSIYPIFTASIPEAVCIPCDETENGTINPESIDFTNLLEGSDAVLFGCGLGKGENIKKLTEKIIKICKIPLIIDADGINTIAESIELLKETKVPLIITPHPKEMSRMSGLSVSEIEGKRTEVASSFAIKNNCTVCLKGCRTVIAGNDGSITVNFTGNPGMATGGSGDVLSGIILSLVAQGIPPLTAAQNGVYLHGDAGDKAAVKRSFHALLPSDIIEEL